MGYWIALAGFAGCACGLLIAGLCQAARGGDDAAEHARDRERQFDRGFEVGAQAAAEVRER